MDTFISTKYQTPLIFDSDPMETGQITFQYFEPIGRRGPQIIQTMGAIQNIQFTQGSFYSSGREAAYTRSFPSMKQISVATSRNE